MPTPLRTILAALVGVALLVPAIGAAAVEEDPPVTTPVETTPLPPDPVPAEPPVITVEAPPEQQTITLQVPMTPEPQAAPVKRKLVKPRTHRRPVTHTRVERVSEPEPQSRAEVAPVTKAKAKPKAKPRRKAKVKKLRRHVAVAPVVAPQLRVPDPEPAHGVLAARFSEPAAIDPDATDPAVLYLAVALATVLGLLLGVVVTAPVLADRWPEVFMPVIDATERIVLAGVCVAGAALTLAITWVLTGPGV